MIHNTGRQVFPLFFAQIFGMTGAIMVTFLGGIVGLQLTTHRTLITAPIALLVIGTAVCALPSASLMKKIGRKSGSLVAAGIATAGALLAALAIEHHAFGLFCSACFLIGVNSAFVLQYRFAVIEGVAARFTATAVSLLLFGNIISAYISTQFANIARAWYAVPYVGSFLVLAILLSGSMIALAWYQEPARTLSPAKPTAGADTPLIIEKNLPFAIVLATCSYFIMSLVMVATPVVMHQLPYLSLHDITWVMQCHLIAMYFPSLIVGFLAQRWGNLKVALLGIGCLLICLMVNISGLQLWHFVTGLILLGVGWNFSFVTATTILTESYWAEHRFKAQALNDFFVFGCNALASLCAGTLAIAIGWQKLNLLAMVVLVLMLGAALCIGRNRKRLLQARN